MKFASSNFKMDEADRQQLCPRCSVPGGEQHYMNRLHINFMEQVDMCPNQKCLWIQLVSAESGTDSQTQLPGGLTDIPGPDGGAGDEFDRLLSSLCEPAADSGVDADGSERSLSSWEPAPSDSGSFCSELAGVGLSSAASEAGGGDWRSASVPAGPVSVRSSLAAETRSEPDPAAARKAARRARLADPRALSGLSLRAFNNSEIRLPRNERDTSQEIQPPHRPRYRKHPSKATRQLKKAAQLEKEAAAATKAAQKRTPAATSTSVITAATAGPSPVSHSISNTATTTSCSSAPTASDNCCPSPAAAAAPDASPSQAARPVHSGPAKRNTSLGRRVRMPTPRVARPRASVSEVAAKMDGMLASAELRSLCSSLNTDQVYVRARQVERVRAWARRKAGAGTGEDKQRVQRSEKHCQKLGARQASPVS